MPDMGDRAYSGTDFNSIEESKRGESYPLYYTDSRFLSVAYVIRTSKTEQIHVYFSGRKSSPKPWQSRDDDAVEEGFRKSAYKEDAESRVKNEEVPCHQISAYDHLNNEDPAFHAILKAVLKKAILSKYGAVRAAADLVRIMEESERFYHRNSTLARDIRTSIESGSY